MKKHIIIWAMSGIGLWAAGCGQNNSEQKVLTRDGALNAELKAIDKQVQSLRNNENLRQFFYQQDELKSLATEYAYWQEVRIYLDKNGLRKVKLSGDPEQSMQSEELYFNKSGELIYATKMIPDTGDEEFYFILNKLVKATGKDDRPLKLKSSNVKLTAINLVSEAKKFRKYVANKKLKP